LQFKVEHGSGSAAGSYSGDPYRSSVTSPTGLAHQGTINLASTTRSARETDQDYTLMHELGHHRSVVEGTTHSDLQRSSAQRKNPKYGSGFPIKPSVIAKEEAFADKNAADRLVRRRGDVTPTTRGTPYPPHGYFRDQPQRESFSKSYKTAYPERANNYVQQTKAASQGRQLATQDIKRPEWKMSGPTVLGWKRQAMQERAPSQQRLFSRDAEEHQTKGKADWGQHLLVQGGDYNKPLDTVHVGHGFGPAGESTGASRSFLGTVGNISPQEFGQRFMPSKQDRREQFGFR
jgi:hypothetical protein